MSSVQSPQPVPLVENDGYVGTVAEISASTVLVELDTKKGRRVSVGGYVVIHSDDHLILSSITRVSLRHMQEDEEDSTNGSHGGKSIPVAGLQLLSTITAATGEVFRGVKTPPRIGDQVYEAPADLVRRVAEFRGSASGLNEKVQFRFATLTDAERTPVTFTPEMIFGQHCAILGASGGGKSWTVARVIEEAATFNSKVILIDATGEFAGLGKGVLHAIVGKHPNPPPSSLEVVMPYDQLTEGDLFAIFRPTGQSQAPKLRAAIKSLKLVRLAPSIGVDGVVIKANRSKQHYENEYAKNFAVLERPDAPFDITRLVRQIHNECVHPDRSSTETQYWGDANAVEQAHCVPLINRIQDIINSENLAPIFKPGDKPSLLSAIEKFLSHPNARVLCISFQYLSFAHHAREILANTIGRYLMKKAREEFFKKKPLVVVLDEAHQFFDRNTDNREEAYPLDSFGLIAKEGRKYALTLVIATQRPREIPETILSQFGTMIVHRLINERDLSVVERASGELDRTALRSLPRLAPGQAVILGVAFPIPLAIQMLKPIAEPNSRGPNFQDRWSE